MAHFIGFVQGGRGEASRVGTKASGLSATARGWDIGGTVSVVNDEKRGDSVRFSIDGGSNNTREKPFCEVFSDGSVVFADSAMNHAWKMMKEVKG